MYLSHFGLNEQPFSIAPDPSFLYLSGHHQEALGHLLYGAGQTGGFVALTGEVGTGKTTLVRTLLEQKLENVDIALCLNPGLSVNDFVESLCDELGVSYELGASLRQLSATLNEALLASHAAGRHSVAIIDEAQNLSREVLEQIRLLTNLETNKDKLLRIILVGQPELQQLLARNDLRQLAQRITARYHLGELSKSDTAAYIEHRLSVAGTQNRVFSAAALKAVHGYSAGTPRLINILCDRALTLAYAEELDDVNAGHIKKAAKELLPGKKAQAGSLPALAILSFVVLISIVVWLYLRPLATEMYQQLMPSGPDVVAGSGPQKVEPIPEPVEVPPVQGQIEAAVAAVEPLEDSPEPEVEADQLEVLFSYDKAVSDLLARWNVNAPIDPSKLCSEALQFQLRCLSGSGELGEVIQFNRPVLLTISRPGSISQALLQAVDGDKLVMQTNDGLFSVSSELAEQFWTGEYQLLLKLPAAGIFTLRPGQNNAGVAWLQEQIALYDKLDVKQDSVGVYDTNLQKRVEIFQANNGLSADGVVGGQTLTLLQNLRPAAGTPLLIQAAN